MFNVDHPQVTTSEAPVAITAQAIRTKKSETQRQNVMGVCDLVNLNGSGQADLYPVSWANHYFYLGKPYPIPYVPNIDEAGAKVVILAQPKHGRLEPTNSDGDWASSRYLPDAETIRRGEDDVDSRCSRRWLVERRRYGRFRRVVFRTGG